MLASSKNVVKRSFVGFPNVASVKQAGLGLQAGQPGFISGCPATRLSGQPPAFRATSTIGGAGLGRMTIGRRDPWRVRNN
jgi:hypothetical protein